MKGRSRKVLFPITERKPRKKARILDRKWQKLGFNN